MSQPDNDKKKRTILENKLAFYRRQVAPNPFLNRLEYIVPVRKVEPAQTTWTGVTSLDLALGGKLPAGFVEVFGEESVGKTALLNTIAASAQKAGMAVLWVASEPFDADYAKESGVDLSFMALVSPKYMEAAWRSVQDFLASTHAAVVLVDSVAALRPEDDCPGRWKWLVWDFMNNARPVVGLSSTVIMANQVRSKRSVDSRRVFSGGSDSAAVKIAEEFDVRLHLSRENISEGGYTMNVDIVSNIQAPPGRVVQVAATKAGGVCTATSTLSEARKAKVVTVRGSHWHYLHDVLGSSLGSAVETLKRKPELEHRLRESILRR